MKILVVLFFHMDEKKTNYTSSCLFYQDEKEILIRPDHSFYRHGFTKKKDYRPAESPAFLDIP